MSGAVLSVRGLCKRYESFALRDVSFDLRPGAITGFIGRNGAGKTTTLKSLLNLVHPDAGEIRFFGLDFQGHEGEVKSRIGFVPGGFRCYARKRLRTITAVASRFYPAWDGEAYRRCLRRFDLDESKTPAQLSEGMKVKYALTLALSHHAELLLLDEPTSGLDPVSRDELAGVFLELQREGVTLLFSTHITADLEKCADDILYLKDGALVGHGPIADFLARYRVARWTGAALARPGLIGAKEDKSGWSALAEVDFRPPEGVSLSPATLDDVMVHMERGEEHG